MGKQRQNKCFFLRKINYCPRQHSSSLNKSRRRKTKNVLALLCHFVCCGCFPWRFFTFPGWSPKLHPRAAFESHRSSKSLEEQCCSLLTPLHREGKSSFNDFSGRVFFRKKSCESDSYLVLYETFTRVKC